MPSKVKISKHLLLKWLQRLRLRFRGHKGYKLIANYEDESFIDQDQMLLLGDPYCEYHSADASVSIHCEILKHKLFGETNDPFSNLPEELLEQMIRLESVSMSLKMAQLNKHLRQAATNIMRKIDIDSLWVAAEEKNGIVIFVVEVKTNGKIEKLIAEGAGDTFLCAKNAFSTALLILRCFNCSQAVFGVRLNDCPIPEDLMYMSFPGVDKFQRVKHVHWSYQAPRQLLRLLSAGAIFF